MCAQISSIEKNNNEPKLSTMQLQSALHVETRSDKLSTTLDSGHSDGTAQASQNDIDINDHIPVKQTSNLSRRQLVAGPVSLEM